MKNRLFTSRVRGVGTELDGNIRVTSNFPFYGALAYTDGRLPGW